MQSSTTDSYWDRLANLVGKVRDWVAALPKREPAVLLGAVGSALVATQQALAGANVHTWKEAVPVVLSLVIRQVVTSPASRDKLLAFAEQDLLGRIQQAGAGDKPSTT